MIPDKRCALLAALLILWLSTLGALAQTAREQAEAELVKARELMSQGYFDSAVVGYQKAFELDPSFVQAYAELAEIMLEKRNFAYSIQLYQKLEVLEPENPNWTKVLFSLYDTYEMSSEEILAGERLIALGAADADTLKKLAEAYKQTNRSAEQLATLELYAEATEVDATFWDEMSQLYNGQARYEEAAEAARKASELDPDNRKYKVALALSLIDLRRLDEAESILGELSAQNPDDLGLKGNLARLYSARGDSYLENERGNTALKYYRQAKDLTAGGDVPEPEAIAPSWNYQRAFYQDLRQSSMSGSLDERIALAETLMRPSLDSFNDFGRWGDNSYFRSMNTVRVPIGGTELDLRARHVHMGVDSPVGKANTEFLYGGLRYNFNRTLSLEAYAGPYGLYDLNLVTQSDNFIGGLRRYRDMWNWTPLGVDQRLRYDGTGGFFDWAVADRFSIAGDVDFQNFDDGVDQTIYNIGGTYLLLNDPGKRNWGLSYTYSGQTNSRFVDPDLRFAPRALNAHTVGTEYSDIVNDVFRYRLGYYYSFVNDGTDGSNFLVGTDFKLGPNSFIGLEYNYGTFSQGQLLPTTQDVGGNDNYNLRADLRVTF